MDAVDLIQQDHRKIEELLGKFLEPESGMTQEELVQEIQSTLLAYAEIEEGIFYPAVKEFAPEQVREGLADHAEVRKLLAELLDADANEETLEMRFETLMDDVRRHIEKEESPNGLLELARRRLDASTLSEMGTSMSRIRHAVRGDLAA